MTPLLVGGAVVLLLLAFWLRAAGTAISRVPRADALRDDSDDVVGAGTVADLIEEREVITPAVGVVASALLIFSSVLATSVVVVDRSAGEAVTGAFMVGIVAFLVGDLFPRQVGRWNSHRVAYRSSRLLTAAVTLGGWANDLLPEPEQDVPDQGELAEAADEQERELIESVLEFGETIVREVMTPRPDMITIQVDASIEKLVDLATDEGFSRVPVSNDGDIVGLVIVKDLLHMLTDDDRPTAVAEVMRPVKFVPETKHASVLLGEMQTTHIHQVVVVDEYGDVAGLVTIEDLLEELVGEIGDETDIEESMISSAGDAWDVDARLPVDDLAEAVGAELPDDEWDTVGGLVLALAERVPEEGEVFEYQQLLFRVSRMQGRRVSQVTVSWADRISQL